MRKSILKSIIEFFKDRIRFVKESGFLLSSATHDRKIQGRLCRNAPKPVSVGNFRDFFNDRRGIIIIVTLVMIIMLTMVALDLHETTLRTYERIRNENNSFQADSFAKGAMEMMLLKLNEHDVGYNLDKVTCNYGTYAEGQSANTSKLCENFDDFFAKNPETGEDRNAFFTMEVKGRNGEAEKLKTGKCGTPQHKFNTECYTVPFVGTGSAGDKERCKMYKPVFVGDPVGSQYVSESVIGLKDYELDQLNYSCNWGKLALGHSDMDRIAIPLYYEEHTDDGTLGDIVNPFYGDFPKASDLILRVRTPCLPCVYDQKDLVIGPEKKNRLCEKGQDDTVCNDNDRYELDDGGATEKKIETEDATVLEENDVVVQWRIYGEKDDASNDVCGVVAIPDSKTKFLDLDPFDDVEYPGSAVYEFSINYQSDFSARNYYLLDITEELGHDICSDPKLKDEEKRKDIDEYLRSLEKPILTLSVIAPLWTEKGFPIPYLEYQVLTDYPVTNPEMKIETTSSLEGMGRKKIMYKDVPVSVMDFAVQN